MLGKLGKRNQDARYFRLGFVSDHPRSVLAGRYLNDLHSSRVKADYDLVKCDVASPSHAHECVEVAMDICSLLEHLDAADRALSKQASRITGGGLRPARPRRHDRDRTAIRQQLHRELRPHARAADARRRRVGDLRRALLRPFFSLPADGQRLGRADGGKHAFAQPWTERQVLLVGIGDSVTAGFGATKGHSYFDRLGDNPPDEFAELNGICLSAVLPNLKTLNLAISGSNSLQHLGHIRDRLPRQDAKTSSAWS